MCGRSATAKNISDFVKINLIKLCDNDKGWPIALLSLKIIMSSVDNMIITL